MTVTLKVVKGLRYPIVRKGIAAVATAGQQLGTGVYLHSLFLGTWWFAGNRVNVPDFKIGQRYNLHRGDPTKFITVEVTAIGQP